MGIEDQMQETSGVSRFFIKTCIPIDRSAIGFSVLEMSRGTRAPVNAYLVLICAKLETAECVASYFL